MPPDRKLQRRFRMLKIASTQLVLESILDTIKAYGHIRFVEIVKDWICKGGTKMRGRPLGLIASRLPLPRFQASVVTSSFPQCSNNQAMFLKQS